MAYQNVFGTPDGETVLFDLIEFSNFMRAQAEGVEAANFDAGSRAIILYILDQISFDARKLLAFTQRRVDENDAEE